MTKYIWYVCILCFFLISCGKTEEEDVTQKPKKEFYVDVIHTQDSIGTGQLIKTGRVQSTQDIGITSNATGQVTSLRVKTGDSVSAGQVLATFNDTLGNYSTSLERANNGVQRANLQYESQKITLDAQVFDAQVQLEKLQNNKIALEADTTQSLIQAEDTLENSLYAWLDSTSALQVEQMDANIEKMKLDYEQQLITNQNTLNSYDATLKKEFSSMYTSVDDVIEFSDSLLWVTEKNKRANDSFEDFLGIRDTTTKQLAKKHLNNLIDFREGTTFSEIQDMIHRGDMTPQEVQEALDVIDIGYNLSLELLTDMEQTINNSIESAGSLSSTQISWYITTLNSYQSAIQGKYGTFLSFASGAENFLNTYEQSEISLLKTIELQQQERAIFLRQLESWELSAETAYNKTKINAQDSLQNIDAQIQIAQNTLDNAIQTRSVTLKSLQNSITEAQITYKAAVKDYSKLTITSPINGTISRVDIDIGQEVFSGTPLFSVVSDDTPEVEVAFSRGEKIFVYEWQEVFVVVDDEKIPGSIYAVSEVADENLNYPATIIFASGTNIIGNIVEVTIPIYNERLILPLNIISVKGDDIGTVKTLSGATMVDVRVRMWDIYGDQVEIVSCARQCEELNIITNDVSNFDPNTFVIVEKTDEDTIN